MTLRTAPAFLAQHLPRDDVGVVLHAGDEDLVAAFTKARPKLCATRLIASVVPRTKTISRTSAAFMKARTFRRTPSYDSRGALAEVMHAAVDVGILFLVVPHHRIDHRLGLLARRGVVEIDQRLAVHALPEERKMVPASGDA